MKILFAADEQPYSAYALTEVTRLALNTWADVTIVGVTAAGVAEPDVEPEQPLLSALHRYRESFLQNAAAELSPYARGNYRYEWVPLRGGRWEEMLVARGAKKDLKVLLRAGTAAQEILAEARERKATSSSWGAPKASNVSGGTGRRCPSEWSTTPTAPSSW